MTEKILLQPLKAKAPKGKNKLKIKIWADLVLPKPPSSGDNDIEFVWHYSGTSNGMTRFFPMVGRRKKATIIIAKGAGKLIHSTHGAPEGYIPQLRTLDQITSVAAHEFGHALGLAHCSYPKDMMFTGDENQPGLSRQISMLDMEVLSQMYKEISDNATLVPQSIPETSWQAL